MKIKFPIKLIHYYWYGSDYEYDTKAKLGFLIRLAYCILTKRKCDSCNGTNNGFCMDGTCEHCFIGWDVEFHNHPKGFYEDFADWCETQEADG